MVDSLKDIRCFIGVSAPDSLATQLNKQAKEWRDQGLYPDFKWTKKQDYHVTLHFIGETPHAQVHRLIDELTNSKLIQKITSAMAALKEETSITLTGFPTPEAAKFIVAELPETPALTHLREEISEVLKRLGIDVNTKPFRPHISLARLKPKHTPPSIGKLGQITSQFKFDHYSLFKSMLTPEGSHYEVLASMS